MSPQVCKQKMLELGVCVIIPTYNNPKTILQVIAECQPYAPTIYAVNDGSTDNTLTLLNACAVKELTVLSYAHNKGKAHALKVAFRQAYADRFRYAITLDADGQHKAEDIPSFIEVLEQQLKAAPGVGQGQEPFLVGQRSFQVENMPSKNKFANRFSNFWFSLQTFKNLRDTQSGFRCYPLSYASKVGSIPPRYEGELAFLIFAAWRCIPLIPVPIQVVYPSAEERVSHFKPARDFTRISLLNTVACLLMLVYGWPRMFLQRLWMILVTLYSGMVYFGTMLFYVTPISLYYAHFKSTEQAREHFHQIVQKCHIFFAHRFPYVNTITQNLEQVTQGDPCIIISNHQSYLDLVCVLMLSPKIAVMTTDWLWKNPLFSPILRFAEFYPASAGLEENEAHMRDLMSRGYSVMIFPEGTRSVDRHILPFHQGAFYYQQKLQVDLQPLLLYGTGKVLPKHHPWIRKGVFYVEARERIPFDDTRFGTTLKEKAAQWQAYYTREYAALEQKMIGNYEKRH